MNNLRVAWLLPKSFFYWQPTLSKLTEWLPNTTVFAALWPGYAQGFKNYIKVELVGNDNHKKTYLKAVYDNKVDFLPLNIINKLFHYQPDVIFSNSFGIWTIIAILFKFLGRWRVIIAYEGSSPGVDFRNSLPRLWVRRIMVYLADAYITNSQAGKVYLTEVLGAKVDRVFARPYEVPDAKALLQNCEETQISEPELKKSIKKPVFLFVGQVVERKGIRYLLEACTILQQQGYNNYTLLIVGDGVQREELQSLTVANNLSQQVQWLGRVDYSSLGAYFNIADVFVLPTLEDTWGVVVQEAMIFGKPVLCSKHAGASELILAGENGYCFEPEKPNELAHLMRSFVENPKVCVTMGEKAKQLVAGHTPDAAAEFLSQVALFAMNQK